MLHRLEYAGVAESMLDGEIAYRKGEFEAAFSKLREAVRMRYNLHCEQSVDTGLNNYSPTGVTTRTEFTGNR